MFQVPVKISAADSSSSTKTKCSNEYHIDKKTTYLAFQIYKHLLFGGGGFGWGFGERFRICTLMDKNVYEKARGHSIDTVPLSTVKWYMKHLPKVKIIRRQYSLNKYSWFNWK